MKLDIFYLDSILDDDLSTCKEWREGDVIKRVEWLVASYKAIKKENAMLWNLIEGRKENE